ncbi:putative MFS-type transporter [Lachnellula suecica]|uniref:Putative MFS-type transporter n=1 Tax=Lachnellula suecica TaxID=602035 RepID=A0A8T9CJY7_9HELO|nr:putative MFS-type transporter [Lachnellula suecica]
MADIRHRSNSNSETMVGQSTTTLGQHENEKPIERPLSQVRICMILATVVCITFLNSVFSGLMTVSLPTIASDVLLAETLLLWPAAVSSLACGCTLLIFGSVSDVVGNRIIYLVGTFFLSTTTVFCGLSRTGLELILSRTAQGLAMALCLPSSVSLITKNIPQGRFRNIAISCLGAGQPVGFGVGMVVGGLFIRYLRWRYAFYVGGALTFVIFVCSVFALPKDAVTSESISDTFRRLKREIDWIGCVLLSTCLGLFTYDFSVLASGARNILTPASITLSVAAVLLIPLFVFWIHRQERLHRKVIIPPSLWRNKIFASLCTIVFVAWGSFNASQYFIALYFQLVVNLDAYKTALLFLPQVISGLATNLMTGWLVKHVRADVLIICSGIITAICPVLMATIDPEWSYWRSAFFALCCIPVCADVLFTVANLLIVSLFPADTHGLAGGVFNTASNIGNSVGLSITAVIAASVTAADIDEYPMHVSLMNGYRAAFWASFAANVLILFIAGYGLRKVGKVGALVEKAVPFAVRKDNSVVYGCC